jgi:hypothetical protein
MTRSPAKAAAGDDAAAKKAKKEQEKKEADEKAAVLAKTQQTFMANFDEGAKLAYDEFKNELDILKGSLPDGVTITEDNGGFGVTVAEGATAETIGSALGYMNQKSENSDAIKGQLQFWIGDLVNISVAKGIYANGAEAGRDISKQLLAKSGKSLSPSIIDNYRRMSERTPVRLRNPRADMSSYLLVSNMKTPKKGDKESEADFKTRVEQFESDREQLQTKLAAGDVKSHKDMKPLVEKLLIERGIKEAPSDTPKLSLVDYLTIYFQTSVALSDFLDTHTEGVVEYKKGEKIHTLTKDQLQEQFDDAKANLVNVFFKDKKGTYDFAALVRGYTEQEKEVIVNVNGDAVKQKTKVKTEVYPHPFWDIIEEAPAPAATTDSTAAPEAGAAATEGGSAPAETAPAEATANA